MSVAIFRGDTSTTYDIGEPQAFTTDSGLSGLSVVVLSPEHVTVLYALSDGSTQISGQLNGSYATWVDVSTEVDQMMSTVSLEGDAA